MGTCTGAGFQGFTVVWFIICISCPHFTRNNHLQCLEIEPKVVNKLSSRPISSLFRQMCSHSWKLVLRLFCYLFTLLMQISIVKTKTISRRQITDCDVFGCFSKWISPSVLCGIIKLDFDYSKFVGKMSGSPWLQKRSYCVPKWF